MTVTPDPADPIDVVQRFLEALAEGDTEIAVSLVGDELVYANVSLPTIRGKHRFAKAADFYFRHMGFDVRVRGIAANGPVVLTERTDQLILGPVRLELWVCGTFEVADGQIVLWRDYFDWANSTIGLFRAIAGAVVPALRPRPLRP
ncbi:MAG TPA: limonene-1,2-epoxide hydrolase family protein [Acidimicrobiales bacterium]|jgi:limonene-1,2-epoxide hydrolase|nr:limonene-1,2-epoxide hydrolase family protein [Acidimicrobiales bacterium]